MLAEPGSVCARAIRHARAVGERQPWRAERALVVGTGAIGMLSTYFLRLDGFEVWTAGRSPAPDPEGAAGRGLRRALRVHGADARLAELAGESGGFDVVIEATGRRPGHARHARAAAAATAWRACSASTGAPREVTLDGRVLGVDAILQNRALIGSVNAHARDWEAAVGQLDRARERWGEALEAFVGLRVPVDRFAEAFEFGGVKATLRFD